jgi:chorismate mutase
VDELLLRKGYMANKIVQKTLAELRQEIDHVDGQLLKLLSERLELVKQVGLYKKVHAIAPLQQGRWRAVLESRQAVGKELGLRPEFVTIVWNQIHDEALAIEEKIAEQEPK